MSVSFSCHCPERKKPVRERNWVLIQYKSNHSAFNGYHYTPSDYSEVGCNTCGACGRTKAKYVHELRPGVFDPQCRQSVVAAGEDVN